MSHAPSRRRSARAAIPAGRAVRLPAWLVPTAAALVALAIRLWALRHQPWVTIDGTEYVRFAESLAEGRPFPSVFPPGYPALIAIARLLVPDRVVAAAAVSLIAGALLPWPVWALARRAAGPGRAALAAMAVALHPILIQYSAITMSESAYLLALYGALALAAAGRGAPAGLALGAGFAVRPEALLPAASLAFREGARVARRAATARTLSLAAAGFLVLAIPCWVYFHATLGAWTLTPKLSAFRAPGASWQAEERRFLAPSAEAGPPEAVPLTRRIGDAVRHAPSNAVAHGRSLLALWPAPLLLLSLWGLWRRRGIEAIPLLHLLAIPFLGLSGQPRFVLSAVPALAVLACVPPGEAARRGVIVVAAALWLGGAAWCGAERSREIVLPVESYTQAQKEAGEWLSGIAAAGEPVMDRKPHLAFYARLPYRVMPETDYDRLLDFAVSSGVRYLVLDEAVVRVFRPQLQPLIYDPGAREREPRLEMIYAGGHFKGYGLVIFRVLRPGEAKTGQAPRFDVRWRLPGGALPPDLRPADP